MPKLLVVLTAALILSAAADVPDRPDLPDHRVVAGRLSDADLERLTADGVSIIDLDATEMLEIDAVRTALRAADAEMRSVALHGRHGDRVGEAWGAYLALDRGVEPGKAVAAAKSVGLADPRTEARLRAELHPDGDSWTRVDPHEMDDARRTQMKQALLARDMMFTRLFATLGAVLGQPEPDGGAVAAISVCKDEAPRIECFAVNPSNPLEVGEHSACWSCESRPLECRPVAERVAGSGRTGGLDGRHDRRSDLATNANTARF